MAGQIRSGTPGGMSVSVSDAMRTRMSACFMPKQRAIICSVAGTPASVSTFVMASTDKTSLSTRTPSQSKMMRSQALAMIGGFLVGRWSDQVGLSV